MSMPHPVCPICLVYHVKLLALFSQLKVDFASDYDTFNCSSCEAILHIQNNKDNVIIPSALFYIGKTTFFINLIDKTLTINTISIDKGMKTKTIKFISLTEAIDKINTYKLYA